MKMTLKQLAREAGVSTATASLALSDSPGVAQKTRRRIQELAQHLNYHPNPVARSLAGGANQLLGVLVDSRAPRIQFRMLAFIEREAACRGYRIMIGEAHDNVGHLRQIHDTFRQYGADGTICLAHDYPEQEEEFRNAFEGCPNIVYVGRPKLAHASYVDIDRSDACRGAILHLHEQGYRNIGMVCSARNYSSVQRRIELFRKTLRELGDPDPGSRVYRIGEEDGQNLYEKLYQEKILTGVFDALLMESDESAALLCKMLAGKERKIPLEFGVIGSDNDDICDICTPEISSVDDEQKLIAYHSVRMLLEILKDGNSDQIDRSLTVKSRLVIRESSMKSTADATRVYEKILA